VSAVVHIATVGAFAWFGAAADLGLLWWVGVAVTAAILVYEHAIVRPDDLSRVNRAFFTANGVIGIGLFAFALADLIRLGLSA
jgi:4-hydroxybenzoate polyprenyltransferase